MRRSRFIIEVAAWSAIAYGAGFAVGVWCARAWEQLPPPVKQPEPVPHKLEAVAA